jgi:hypothetical protein
MALYTILLGLLASRKSHNQTSWCQNACQRNSQTRLTIFCGNWGFGIYSKYNQLGLLMLHLHHLQTSARCGRLPRPPFSSAACQCRSCYRFILLAGPIVDRFPSPFVQIERVSVDGCECHAIGHFGHATQLVIGRRSTSHAWHSHVYCVIFACGPRQRTSPEVAT